MQNQNYSQQGYPQPYVPNQQGYPNQPLPQAGIGLIILSFVIPIVGLILFFAKKNDVANPSAYLIAAAVSFVLGLILQMALT